MQEEWDGRGAGLLQEAEDGLLQEEGYVRGAGLLLGAGDGRGAGLLQGAEVGAGAGLLQGTGDVTGAGLLQVAGSRTGADTGLLKGAWRRAGLPSVEAASCRLQEDGRRSLFSENTMAPWLPGSQAPWLPDSLAAWLPGQLAGHCFPTLSASACHIKTLCLGRFQWDVRTPVLCHCPVNPRVRLMSDTRTLPVQCETDVGHSDTLPLERTLGRT